MPLGRITRRQREAIADWLTVIGAVALLGSLFLTWSHQFSPAFLGRWGASDVLRGVPHDPTAWQVYSTTDVLLALLAAALVAVALWGGRPARACTIAASLGAVVFILHAVGHPPTNGANVFDPALKQYTPNAPRSGTGEVVAIVGLGLAMAGLGLSFTAD